jgi:RNA polymerase sigma-70 factor (sigma-E family)
VQNGLARTWPRWNRLRDPAAAEAYVRRVMVNTSISWWRRRWNREVATADLPEPAYANDSTAAVDENLRLQQALARLAPRMRAVIVLRYAEDRTEAEVAAIMGISVGAVKSAASRGLARLREFDEFAADRADRINQVDRTESRVAAPAPTHVDEGPA